MMASKMLPDCSADIALDATESADALAMMWLATACAGLPSGGTVAAARTMPFATVGAVSGVGVKVRRNVFGWATMGSWERGLPWDSCRGNGIHFFQELLDCSSGPEGSFRSEDGMDTDESRVLE